MDISCYFKYTCRYCPTAWQRSLPILAIYLCIQLNILSFKIFNVITPSSRRPTMRPSIVRFPLCEGLCPSVPKHIDHVAYPIPVKFGWFYSYILNACHHVHCYNHNIVRKVRVGTGGLLRCM